jgi:hypothetical protein
MTRTSKQAKDRSVSYKKPRPLSPKSGPKRDQLLFGYRVHENALSSESAPSRFFPKNP